MPWPRVKMSTLHTEMNGYITLLGQMCCEMVRNAQHKSKILLNASDFLPNIF